MSKLFSSFLSNFFYTMNNSNISISDYPTSPVEYTYSTVPDLYPTLDCPSLDDCSSFSSSSSSSSSASSASNTPEPESLGAIKITKTSTPPKQYRCTECLKYFNRPSALKTHSYTHTSEKPFKCTKSGCGRRFSVVSNLRRHFKVHQKPAVSTRVSSEDRVRYVRQLIRTSEVILAQQKQAEQAQNSLAGRSQYNENHEEKDKIYSAPLVHLPQPISSNYQYQHYFLAPAISNIVNNISPIQSNANNNKNNYLSSSYMALPCSWNNVEQNTGVHNPFNQQSHFGNNHVNPASNFDKQNSAFTQNISNNYRGKE